MKNFALRAVCALIAFAPLTTPVLAEEQRLVPVLADKPAQTVPAQAPTSAPAKLPWLYEGSDVPVDASWTFGELPNGLRYAVKRNVVPGRQVSIRVRIDAGSLHENDNELGFAHLIEHLSFRGSTFVPDGEAKRIWQRFGVTFGSDSNAQTTPTQTVYKLDLPNAQPATLEESVKIISGMMRGPRISPEALNAERSIVLAELRENSGAQMVQSDAMRNHFFQGQRLAKRPTIGTPETLNAATAEALSAFHKRWYRPDKTVIVMAGDSDPETLVALIRKHFSEWRNEGASAAEPSFGAPAPGGKAAELLVEPTLPNVATIMYARPWVKVDDTIAYNQQILINALAARIINRRLEVIARSGGNFLTAEVGQDKISRSADTTYISVTPIGDRWEAAIKDVRSVIADATENAPSQPDIDRELKLFADVLRTQLDSYPFEAASAQADDIVRAVDIRETVAAPQTVVDVFDGMRNQFTPDRLLASAKATFSGVTSRILLSSPQKIDAAETRLASALSAPVKANQAARLAQDVLGFDALPKLGKPATIVARKPYPRFEMETVTFSNGARAILYPNKAESGQIRMKIRFGNGYQSVAPEKGGLFWTGPLVIGQNGIGKLRRTQIDQIINGRRLDLAFSVDYNAFEFSATTRPEDLQDQLLLIATQMDHPGWDPAAVERAKALGNASYASFDMSASSVLQRDLQYLLTSKDARWKQPGPAEIAKTSPKNFKEFWAPLLASGPVEIMLFGDFETETGLRAIQNSFGAMKPRKRSVAPAAAQAIAFPAVPAQPVSLQHKGPADVAAAVVAWPTGGGLNRITESRELEILAAIFRDRLFEKFRAEQAASYSPDMANSWPDEFPSGGYLMAYSQVKPQDVDRFFVFADAVAADLVANPVSADELQRAVEPVKQYIERAASGNTFWLSQLKGATYDPRRFENLGHLLSDFSNVTPQRLQQLAKQYFVGDKAWKLIVSPETQPKQQAARAN